MRFAIYFAPPPGSVLHRLGAAWLGRDAFGSQAAQSISDEALSDVTREPRRYGFHATLKPPFELDDGMDSNGLRAAIAAVARDLHATAIDQLALRRIDGFLALVPQQDPEALNILAAACVRELDVFRKPAPEAELRRRRAAGLSESQEQNLRSWGYPFVFEDFRFHMTLSRRLSDAEAAWVEPLARAHFAEAVGAPLAIEALTLFRERAPAQPFEAVECFALGRTH